MKSTQEVLMRRGYVDKDLKQYSEFDQFIKMDKDSLLDVAFKDQQPFQRTFAIRMLREKYNYMDSIYCENLLKALSNEKALYTRLEICASLQKGDEKIADIMCRYIGKVGNNRYNTVPNVLKVSKKKSFPLPRDLVARTLGKMDKTIISVLYKNLNSEEICGDGLCKYELLDAIGYITFYNRELATLENLNKIINLYKQYRTDKYMVWKIVMCCSSFSCDQCYKFLSDIRKDIVNLKDEKENDNITIMAEIDRSIIILNERMK